MSEAPAKRGRPAVDKDLKKRKPNISMSPSLIYALKEASEKTGYSMSELVSACCRQRLPLLVEALIKINAQKLHVALIPYRVVMDIGNRRIFAKISAETPEKAIEAALTIHPGATFVGIGPEFRPIDPDQLRLLQANDIPSPPYVGFQQDPTENRSDRDPACNPVLQETTEDPTSTSRLQSPDQDPQSGEIASPAISPPPAP